MSLPKGLNLDDFIRSLKYQRDIRQDLDSRRRVEFRKGWANATAGTVLAPSTLKKLTWHNLGSRAGKYFGSASSADIESVLNELEERYRRAKAGAR